MNIELILISFSVSVVIFCIGLLIVRLQNKKNILSKFEIENEKKESKLRKIFGKDLKYYVLLMFVFVIVFGLISYLMFSNIIIALIGSCVGFAGPLVIFKAIEKQGKKNFDERYARALRQLSSNLKSGLTIAQAVNETSQSPFIHDSVRELFQQMDADLKVGISVQEAFQRMANKIDNVDAQDVASAIAMQSEVGGNEATVVETITSNISSRIATQREIKSLFASTSFTVWALDIMPFLILIFLAATAPTFISTYFESIEMMIIFFGMSGVMVIGSFVMRRSIKGVKEV